MVDNKFFTEIIELGSAWYFKLHQKLTYHQPNGTYRFSFRIIEIFIEDK
jgi:hypothetical protein